MASDMQRSRSSTSKAERALATLVAACRDKASDLILIGGLVPPHLVPSVVPHQGTTDVDMLLRLELGIDRDDDDFAWLETALLESGFAAATQDGWRWRKMVDGQPVDIEFLCDVPDNRGRVVHLPGAEALGAMNVVGPAAAFVDATPTVLSDADGTSISVNTMGLGSYVAAKASAIVGRGLDKDHYDFAFVIVNAEQHFPGEVGRAVADVVRRATFYDHDITRDIATAVKTFSPGSRFPAAENYARASREAGAEEDLVDLTNDARLAVARFGRDFDRALSASNTPRT